MLFRSLNDGSSTKGRIQNTEEVVIAADTRPEPTIRNSNTPQGIKNQWKPGTPRDRSAFEPFKKTRYEEASTKKNKKALTIDDMKNWDGKSFDNKKLLFFDDEKRIVVGAAMVPNKMIHRYDDFGNMYYVYFSKTSIKKLAEKFMRQGRTDETSVEHDGVKLGSDKVYVTESWVSEDPVKDKSAAYGFKIGRAHV